MTLELSDSTWWMQKSSVVGNTFVSLFLIICLSVRINEFRSRLTGNDTYRNLTEGSVRSIIAAPGDPVSKLF